MEQSNQCQLQAEEEYEDDLAQFQEALTDKIFEEVMSFKPLVQDDANELKNMNKQADELKPTKELTQQERQARDLKLKNARKYFQVVKITYLQQVCFSLKDCQQIVDKHSQKVTQWLSLLNFEIICQFMRLKKIQPLSIQIEDVLQFIKTAKTYISGTHPSLKINWNQICWCLFEQLKLSCRKIYFFDIQQLVQELFYKLRYQSNEKMRRKQKKMNKEQQILKIKIQQKIQEQMKEESSNKYMFLQDFQFDPNSITKTRTSNSSQQSQNQQHRKEVLKARRQNNWIKKKNFKYAYFQVFSPIEDKWKLLNAQILQIQSEEQFKRLVLQTKPIIGFYALKILHFKPQFQQLTQLRELKTITIDDLTLYFYDNYKLINQRRRRVGCKFIMRYMFQKGQFWRYPFMLQNLDQHALKITDDIETQFHLSVFPNSKKQMFTNEYFTVPSQLPQYSILDKNAKPIDKEFNQQKVYRKRDIIGVASRNGWIDRGRKIKDGQLPVKKTQNKSKNLTELFLYQQTEPYALNFNEQTRQLIADDQYNNIYVPPDFKPDERFTIINKKISFVCSKAKIQHLQLVQGFSRSIGRILPNYIGFLVLKQDEPLIMQLYVQRKEKLQQNKGKNRVKQLTLLWNKLFKKIELNEWSQNFMKK